MLIIRTFCFYFTIRLGAVVIGVAYLVECLIMLILSSVWMFSDPASTTTVLKEFLAESKFLYVSDILHRLSKDPSPFRELALTLAFCRIASCGALIYGAYYMKHLYMLPFLFLESFRLIFLMFLHVTAMQIMKKNSQDLGLLIGATLAGAFILMLIGYCWVCVYSLYRVLSKLSHRQMSQRAPLLQHQVDKEEYPPRLLPAYRSNYTTPIAPVY